ncbi:multiple sugar transport system permease protein [Friedmanniella endophytica]|uniref:Multiple sugar transport system permease protein n=1 Tax=Microlunatus kandeliicorticis TaxID=1759536 RepID=A0A7W3P4Q2_9ACTN|nr:carbohydrate ABC transporter permease [Microlunatus kandeliicorticis]MBA8793141.1 multiple sugar transport system permease protein [Microlunatus kandeliicorticis]
MTATSAPTLAAAPRATADVPHRPTRITPGRVVRLVIFYLLLLIIALVFLTPYLFSLNASFKPLAAILSDHAWTPATSLSLTNFKEVLTSNGFATYLGNTVLITVIITVGQVLFSLMGAYAFARLRFPGRDALFWLYLSMLMVPNVVTMIPLYVLMDGAHLLNTYWALFLPYTLGTPYAVFLMRQYFLTLPSEILEAARLDGCSEARILFRILIPLARPIITTAAIIAFVFSWNNFLWPLIATNSSDLQVVTVGLANLQSNFGTQWNLVLAGSILVLIPLVVLFVIFQKQIVNSISLTGTNR